MPALSVAFIVFDGFQSMSLSALPVFEYANATAGEAVYETVVLSEHGGIVRSSMGLSVVTEPFDDRVFDTVIVGSGDSVIEAAPPGLLAFVRDHA